MESFKLEFEKYNLSDKLRCGKFINDELLKIKLENPKKYSNMLCYINNPEKFKERNYKHRTKKKEDIIKIRDETMNMITTINRNRGTE